MKTENTSMHTKTQIVALAALLAGSTLAACGNDDASGSGTLTVVLEPEDVIGGLQAGEDVENIRDGWNVDFDKYIITVGDIDLRFSTDASLEREADDVFVVDLTQVPATGMPLWTLEGLRAGRWEFNYSTPGAAHGATRHESVSQSDFDEIVTNDWTYLLDGVLTKVDGRSCPPSSLATPPDGATPAGTNAGGDACYENPTIRFVFGAPAETRFGPCEVDGVPGFAIAAGGTQTVAISIHGDHPFFNGFPEGDEGGVLRLAQWLADCDLDLDGTVTREELEAVAPSALSEIDERYQLGGSPITPLNNMYELLSAQLKTQGHFQGEGECPFDGTDPGHDH